MIVAAYGRVSTDSSDQENSFNNQETYFKREITAKGYEFGGFYGDLGLTGTRLNKRPEFERLLYDCGIDLVPVYDPITGKKSKKVVYPMPSNRPSKINEIWLKNTSRFARNTLSYEVIKALREKGVYVYFIEQNIHTKDTNKDFILQLFQNFDTQDSRDKSSKTKWGHQEAARQNIIFSKRNIFGYEYNPIEKTLRVTEKTKHEADIILLIHTLYDQDYGFRRIGKILKDKGLKTREGKDFCKNTIRNILTNAKYAGFNNRNRWDNGQVFNKHYPKPLDDVELKSTDKIDIIVPPELFFRNQNKLKTKINYQNQKGIYKGISEYSNLIFCGKCGHVYHSNRDNNGKYIFYNCSFKKLHGKTACDNVNIAKSKLDNLIEPLIGKSFGLMLVNSQIALINNIQSMIYSLVEKLGKDYSEEIQILQKNKEELAVKLDNLIELYAIGNQKDVILNKIKTIENEIKLIEDKINELTKTDVDIINQIRQYDNMIDQIINNPVKLEYTKEEVIEHLDKIIIHPDKEPELRFKVINNNLESAIYPDKKYKQYTDKEKENLEKLLNDKLAILGEKPLSFKFKLKLGNG